MPTEGLSEEKIGPRPSIWVCKGCPAYETEKWREPSGDGETYDRGQYAWCNAAGRKSMGAYHYDHSSTPEWCPARAEGPAPPGGGVLEALTNAADVADALIERAYGTDVPAEWTEAYRAVAEARALTKGADHG